MFRQGPFDFVLTLVFLAVIGWFLITLLPALFVLIVGVILFFVAASIIRGIIGWLKNPSPKKKGNFDSDGRRITQVEVLSISDVEPKNAAPADGAHPGR